MVETAMFRQVTKIASGLRGLGLVHTLQANALKVLLDEAGTEVNVELYQW
jgi:hypothetical protein